MKYINYNLLAIALFLMACKKQEIIAYEQPNRINFESNDILKTVLFDNEEDFVNGVDSILITVSTVTMGKKNNTPLTLYLKTIIDKGITDTAAVKIWKNPSLIDYTQSTHLDTIVVRRPKKPKAVHMIKIGFDFDKSKAFSKGVIENQQVQINVVDQFTEPYWWSYFTGNFGSFSDAKYRLLLRVTNDAYFYYGSNQQIAEAVKNAKAALSSYNAANPGLPLLDDESPAKPISFP